MRVIAGSARSLQLRYPKGADIRPTTDAMREALFSSLGERAEGARVADIYAGCGTVGIEALSRGAALAVFVEKDARCVAALRGNLERTGLEERAVVVRGPAERLWNRTAAAHGPFDVVFADPPYGLASFAELARRLVVDAEGVAQGGLVVLQCGVGDPLPGVPDAVRVRRFGASEMRFYETAHNVLRGGEEALGEP